MSDKDGDVDRPKFVHVAAENKPESFVADEEDFLLPEFRVDDDADVEGELGHLLDI